MLCLAKKHHISITQRYLSKLHGYTLICRFPQRSLYSFSTSYVGLSFDHFISCSSSLRSVSTISCTKTSFPLSCLRPIAHSSCICGDTMCLVYMIPYCSNNVSVLSPPLQSHDQQLMVTLLPWSRKRKLRIQRYI